jgi:hypothetical protein
MADQKPLGRDTITKINSYGVGLGTGIYKYPLNVGGTEVPNYIMFFPLIRENSKAGQDMSTAGTAQEVERPPGNAKTENQAKAAAAGGLMTGAMTGMVAGASLANAGGKIASGAKGGLLSKFITAAIKTVGSGFGMALVGGATAAAAAGIQDNDKTIFSKTALVLQVQDNPKYGYAATWETSELGSMMGAVASGQLDPSLGTAGAGLQLAARKAAGAVKAIGGSGGLNTLIEATSKQTPNPYKEQLFRSVGFREFEFNYRFAPESQAEYDKVKEIIKQFSKHMHPEQDKSGLFFIYPSEFLIVVYHREKENEHVKKMSNCALTNMSIEYGSTGGFTTFEGGIPTEINMRLKFTELELLTNKRIEQGF